MTVLTAVALSKKSRFHDLNFSVAHGEMIFLLGPNGSGKSSLLSALAGYMPCEGHVELNCHRLASLSIHALARLRAWLPQQVQIDPYISINQAFELALFPLGLNKQDNDVQKVLLNITESLDLQHLSSRLLGQLSGGELQRLQIGLRLLQVWPSLNPKACLLLLDEPTNGLDLNHQNALFSLLKKLKQQGLAIIICVHDLNLALRHADKVLMLKNASQYYFGEVFGAFRPEIIESVFEVKSSLIEQNNHWHLILD